MTEEYQELKITREDSIGILTLNRPEKLNALTHRLLWKELPAAIDDVAADADIRVLVITGAGRGFCAGADLGATTAGGKPVFPSPEPQAQRYGFIHRLRNMPKPTIAAVNGAAAGVGMSLALACDIRIAADTARFSAAFVRVARVPDTGASFFLPRLIGTGRAMEMMFTGDLVGAAEADRIGMVNRVVPLADLMSVTMDLAGRIAKNPPIALALAKRISYQWLEQDLMAQMEYEAYNQKLCRETEDYQEAIRAFAEKREPNFRGR